MSKFNSPCYNRRIEYVQLNIMNKSVIYEQPLNEVIRACLKLEQIFQEIDRRSDDTSAPGTRHLISCVVDALQLLDRPDLKTKLAKELNSHLTTLTRYSSMPEIDASKLKQLSQQLEELSRNLIDSNGKIGHRLRDIEMLNTLRLHLAAPGGGCSFDLPLYHYWLQQPADTRRSTIADWLTDFTPIRTAVTLLLDLVRKNAKIDEKDAVHGFYQELLDPQSNLRMIRIGLSPDIKAYPEISVGRHFLSVRYFLPTIEKRPSQYTENLSFWLAYCSL